MPLKLNQCGNLLRAKLDALTPEQASNPQKVTEAMGAAIEAYVEQLLLQLTVTIPPTPGFGTTTSPGSPTAPGPAPLPFVGAAILK